MNKFLKGCLTGAFVISAAVASAQTNKEVAVNKCKEAIELMDNGNFEASFKLLEEAKKLDPNNILFDYETAFAHYLQKDYKAAIKILEGVKGRKDFAANYYGMLGNVYDSDGRFTEAVKVYNEGLKKFPEAGNLYLEKGVAYLGQKQYNEALEIFENGIEADPGHASNYYWASKLWLSTDNEIWGMLYGELFMNLERNSRRTAEISKLLYDTYKSEIKFTSDTSATVSLSKTVLSVSKKPTQKNLQVALYPTILEADLGVAVALEKEISIASLDRVRQNFLNIYFEKKHNKSYPNVLFNYQKILKEQDLFEAYNYWLLMKGDEPAFESWKEANQVKWDKFVEWYSQNPIEINKNNLFRRRTYSL